MCLSVRESEFAYEETQSRHNGGSNSNSSTLVGGMVGFIGRGVPVLYGGIYSASCQFAAD